LSKGDNEAGKLDEAEEIVGVMFPADDGAPRIHGELLKLGFKVAESTVSKYMIKHRRPPLQT